jgi:hypothetical protein
MQKEKNRYIYSTVSLNRIPFWMPISGRRKNKNKDDKMRYVWKNKYGEIYIKTPSTVMLGQQHRNIIDGILAVYKKKRINPDQSVDLLFSLSELKRFINISHTRYIEESIEDMMQAIVTVKFNHLNGFVVDREQIIWEFKEFMVDADWALDKDATVKIQRLPNMKDKKVHLYRIRFSSLFSKLFLKETVLYHFDKDKFRQNIKEIIKLRDAKVQAFVRFCLSQKDGSVWDTEFVLQQIAALDISKKENPNYRKMKYKIITKLKDKKNELQQFGICFNDDYKTFSIKKACKIFKFYFDCNFSQ